ncbi:MAG: sugar kinase [Lentisphaeria bacterium]|nr:sugar kinase [Lentisphaeria bacterium]
MTKRVVTFGEIMGRIAPAGFLRFTQCLPGSIELTFGGGEANVACSLAIFGLDAAFVSALPAENAVADACVHRLRGLGVDVSGIVRARDGRLGLYYLETGANQRGSNVIYDRAGSSVAIVPSAAYDWASLFADAAWFHITGITPAISANTADAALEAVKAAKQAGVTVSCDLNYRKKLWKWDAGTEPQALAERTMRGILPFVDVVIGNEEDAEKVLGIQAVDSDVESGELNVGAYEGVAREIVAQFPNVSKVAITLRESLSATHNNWGALLYDANVGESFLAPLSSGSYQPYEIKTIVDRVGGGDSFAAGLIFALLTEGLDDSANAIRYAVAASCLKHSISGDINYATRPEVEALMGGAASGRVSR